jgi:hypothetical protein
MMNWKGYGGKPLRPVSGYYSSSCLEGFSKTTKHPKVISVPAEIATELPEIGSVTYLSGRISIPGESFLIFW